MSVSLLRQCLTGSLALALACTPRPAPRSAGSTAPASDFKVNTRDVAAKLVGKSLRAREGEIILIAGGAKQMPLLEDIAVEVRKVGAWPLLQVGTESMARRMYEDVPADFDRRTSPLDLKLMGMVNGIVSLEYIENKALFAGIPAERTAARAAADRPVSQLALSRGVRTVALGNGLMPTASNAGLLGVPRDTLSAIFWGGVNTDYTRLQAVADSVRRVLAAGKEVRITNPNGTDLAVRIAGRPIWVNDGVLSDEDLRRGGAATRVSLPAGEVFLAPVPGSAEGKIVADRFIFNGQPIEKLALTISAGRLVKMEAASGLDPLQARYHAGGVGRDLFGVIDIGLNPDVRTVPGSNMVAWMPAGMVTVGIGTNTWAGGTNSAGFGIYPSLPGSTLEVDGKPLVKEGKLVP